MASRNEPAPLGTILRPGAPLAVPAARPGRGAWVALGILCFVYALNFLDRQLLSILAKPIQDDLQVSDGSSGASAVSTSRSSIA